MTLTVTFSKKKRVFSNFIWCYRAKITKTNMADTSPYLQNMVKTSSKNFALSTDNMFRTTIGNILQEIMKSDTSITTRICCPLLWHPQEIRDRAISQPLKIFRVKFFHSKTYLTYMRPSYQFEEISLTVPYYEHFPFLTIIRDKFFKWL